MGIVEALFLGAVQGITEFLPVSSSGHLVLFQRVFGITEPALLFDTVVHGGTLVAVFAALWRDIGRLLRRPFQPLTAYLVLATLPAVVAALALKDAVEAAFSSGAFLGFAFLVTAGLLYSSEAAARRAAAAGNRPPEAFGWRDALIIGALQALAIAPGVSRSGATLSGAIWRRVDRDFAARFSFLLSIPAILGALALQARDVVTAPAAAGGVGAGALAAGAAMAAVVGFFSVRFMLRIVRECSLRGFAVYTAILGTLVLVDRFGTHWWF